MDSKRDDGAAGFEPDVTAGPADDGLTQDERAQAAIFRVMREGADPTAEALALANRFTDEQTSKLARWRRRGRDRH
jgi:hypothetical protein